MMDAKAYLSDRLKQLENDRGEPQVYGDDVQKAIHVLEDGYLDSLESDIMNFHKNISSPQKDCWDYRSEVRLFHEKMVDFGYFIDLAFYGGCFPEKKQVFHKSHLEDLQKADLEYSEKEKVLALEKRAGDLFQRMIGVMIEMDISSISPMAVDIYNTLSEAEL